MYDQIASLGEWGNTTSSGQPTYPLSSEPLFGNLTITLANGYETVIPHHELVSQVRGTDKIGAYAVIDTSHITTSLGSKQNNSTPTLGGVYLSQNYLFVDYKHKFFGLAPAITGNLNPQAHSILPVCNNSTAASTPPESSGGSNTGAIAGGVVGGVFALALVVVGIVWFVRRQSKSKAVEQKLESSPSDADTPIKPFHDPEWNPSTPQMLLSPHRRTESSASEVHDAIELPEHQRD